ncbi:hypothetical protein V5799_030205 [Amblyomma americanum]|uniref:Uncharacterized protein n=1 Tax=Amblyomma americanum TaxID=6943 RepID=A0AAQ4EP30_AMBAM
MNKYKASRAIKIGVSTIYATSYLILFETGDKGAVDDVQFEYSNEELKKMAVWNGANSKILIIRRLESEFSAVLILFEDL